MTDDPEQTPKQVKGKLRRNKGYSDIFLGLTITGVRDNYIGARLYTAVIDIFL